MEQPNAEDLIAAERGERASITDVAGAVLAPEAGVEVAWVSGVTQARRILAEES